MIPPDVLNLMVSLHNEYREKHGAPPVTLDLKLCTEAQRYAKCILTKGHMTSEEELEPCGRNMYHFTSPPQTYVNLKDAMQKALQNWYHKNEDYNWDNPLISSPASKMFSQMIWKSVKSIGIGVESVGTKTVVMVLYWPSLKSPPCEIDHKCNVFPLPHR